MNRRVLALLFAAALIVAAGISQIEPSAPSSVSARSRLVLPPQDISGYARAIDAWNWVFPRDHGAHPAFQTEWWYYTGNLATDDGRRFGFQFTIFRRAISPDASASASEFRADQVYMAHFTVSDVAGGRFYHDQRFSRGGAGLAGATTEPRYRVWLEDWQVAGENDAATKQRISARSGGFAVDLALEQVKRPALQGDNGLSQKSGEIGNASYYYSLTRLLTRGTITIGGESFSLRGATWMDHEFSTSALGEEAQGWDWFGLIFDDNTELMIGQIRQVDGGKEPAFGGLFVDAAGDTRYLEVADFTIAVTDAWRSPHTGAAYPAGWAVEIQGEDGFAFRATPLLADQELYQGDIKYWEGAVRVDGDKSGYGYAELTGYVGTMQNRF